MRVATQSTSPIVTQISVVQQQQYISSPVGCSVLLGAEAHSTCKRHGRQASDRSVYVLQVINSSNDTTRKSLEGTFPRAVALFALRSFMVAVGTATLLKLPFFAAAVDFLSKQPAIQMMGPSVFMPVMKIFMPL